MLITLAYSRDGEVAGATVDLDDTVARRLIGEGRARLAEPATKSPAKPRRKPAAKKASASKAAPTRAPEPAATGDNQGEPT